MLPLSLSSLAVMVLAALAAGFWYDGVRVRETANRIAAAACKRRELQLLDGTVALASVRPRWDKDGPRIERTFVFDYTAEGIGRASGFIIMHGQALQHVGFESDNRASHDNR